MHLGRMVSVVQSCREAIWNEYMALESATPTTTAEIFDLKDEFNAAWLNWEWCVAILVVIASSKVLCHKAI